ncbi:MAG: twin-arginine translocase subunit TatC [Acidobacteriota bacterium]
MALREPGLYKHERKYAAPFILAATLLFLLGGWFGYAVVFPSTCRFFIQVGEDFTPMLKIDEYFALFSTVILGVGAVFEIPAVIFLLAKAGLVTPRFLLRNTRYAIVISFIVAAIVTPTPDPVTCTAVALPMILLYLLGVVVAALTYRPRKRGGDDDPPSGS